MDRVLIISRDLQASLEVVGPCYTVILDDDLYPNEFFEADNTDRQISYFAFPIERTSGDYRTSDWLNVIIQKITTIVASIQNILDHTLQAVYIVPTGSFQSAYLIEYALLLRQYDGSVCVCNELMAEKYHQCVLAWPNSIKRNILPKLEAYYSGGWGCSGRVADGDEGASNIGDGGGSSMCSLAISQDSTY